jgi:hypothetical protein
MLRSDAQHTARSMAQLTARHHRPWAETPLLSGQPRLSDPAPNPPATVVDASKTPFEDLRITTRRLGSTNAGPGSPIGILDAGDPSLADVRWTELRGSPQGAHRNHMSAAKSTGGMSLAEVPRIEAQA